MLVHPCRLKYASISSKQYGYHGNCTPPAICQQKHCGCKLTLYDPNNGNGLVWQPSNANFKHISRTLYKYKLFFKSHVRLACRCHGDDVVDHRKVGHLWKELLYIYPRKYDWTICNYVCDLMNTNLTHLHMNSLLCLYLCSLECVEISVTYIHT